MFLFQNIVNALNVAFTVMKKIVVNADALDLKNGKQKKKLNYSKIINHPKDVFPLKWIGEIQEI